MFNVQIRFIIFSIDLNNDKLVHYVLSSNKKTFIYPSYDLSKGVSLIEAKKLCFENYVPLKLEWIEHRLLDIVQENNTIYIYYICSIPIESKIINGDFLPINQIMAADQILQKGVRTI